LISNGSSRGNSVDLLRQLPILLQRYFKKSLSQDPRHPDVLGRWACWLAQQDRLDEAEEAFEAAIRSDPQHRENLEEFAWFLNQVSPSTLTISTHAQ